MSVSPDPKEALADIARQESRFRTRMISGITEIVVRPDVDPALRVLVVIVFVCLTFISFVFAMFVIHAIIYASANIPFQPLYYVFTISGFVAAILFMAFPLMYQARFVENTLRTRQNFDRIVEARKNRTRREGSPKA